MSKSKKNIEIEIQVQIENPKKLAVFLDKHGSFKGEYRQIDSYYTPPHRDFLAVRPISEWLRVRNSSGKYSLNYKKWYFDKGGKSHYCDEYETSVDNIEQAVYIFQALNMTEVITVDKKRMIWNYQDYEISIDSIKGLGDFVEIEYKGQSSKKPEAITKEMVEFLREQKCGKITRNYVGYPFQMLFPSEVVYEEF